MTIDFYIEENRIPGRQNQQFSPSGKYKLIIDYYKTRDGAWNYSRGIVYRDTELICDIKRNYSVFHYSFITKDDQEWLITGKSYTGQTLVNLDTKEIFDDKKHKTNSYTGNEFCWAEAKLLPNNILMVLGCHWAGPYVYKFFDFNNPKQGWPEFKVVLETVSESLVEEDIYENEDMPPEYKEGKLYVFKTSKIYLPLNKSNDDLTIEDLNEISNEDYENPKNWLIDIKKTQIFEFKEGILKFICETV